MGGTFSIRDVSFDGNVSPPAPGRHVIGEAILPAPLERWRAEGDLKGPAGHRLFLVERGTEERTILLLHGFPAGSWSWHRLLPDLARGARVLAPDLLGFGFSDKPADAAYDLGAHADRIERLLGEVDSGPVHLLAHAYGCSVAQELLARRLEDGSPSRRPRILSAAFLNGGLFPEANRPFPVQRLLAGRLAALAAPFLTLGLRFGRGAFRRKLAATFGRRSPPTDEVLDACWALFSREMKGEVLASILRYPAERRRLRDRLVGALLHGETPLLFAVSPDDPISGSQIGPWLERIGGDGLVLLPSGVGHHPPLEAPVPVLEAYSGFIEGL